MAVDILRIQDYYILIILPVRVGQVFIYLGLFYVKFVGGGSNDLYNGKRRT
jgi:hypothetical protein